MNTLFHQQKNSVIFTVHDAALFILTLELLCICLLNHLDGAHEGGHYLPRRWKATTSGVLAFTIVGSVYLFLWAYGKILTNNAQMDVVLLPAEEYDENRVINAFNRQIAKEENAIVLSEYFHDKLRPTFFAATAVMSTWIYGPPAGLAATGLAAWIEGKELVNDIQKDRAIVEYRG